MNHNHLKTVTIGIPAHNEEQSIGQLLDSILTQDQTLYILEKIIVACDGCTDRTAEIVRNYISRFPYIEIIDDGKRGGQTGRLNNFFKDNISDILITFDGDTVLGHKDVVNKIVLAFDDPDVGLVGCGDKPMRPRNFFEKIVVSGIELWYKTRKDINGGVTIHNHHGCASAAAKRLCKHLRIPSDTVGTDDYRYLKAKELGFHFRFAKDALVYYRAPANIRDFFTQSGRFLVIKHQMVKYFGKSIYQQYTVPRKNKWRGIIITFFRKPFFTILTICLQMILRIFQSKFIKDNQTGLWQTIHSTKSHKN